MPRWVYVCLNQSYPSSRFSSLSLALPLWHILSFQMMADSLTCKAFTFIKTEHGEFIAMQRVIQRSMFLLHNVLGDTESESTLDSIHAATLSGLHLELCLPDDIIVHGIQHQQLGILPSSVLSVLLG